MIRRAAAGALVALAALGATGCGSVWREIINTGAAAHASEHVTEAPRVEAGRVVAGPGVEVLCAIPPTAAEFAQAQPGQVIEDHNWLIPSDAVATFGCEDAYRRATGTHCDTETGCHVSGVWRGQLDGSPYAPLQAPVDPPGRLP